MALNVSSIISAVNKYLYSISDAAKTASDSSKTTDSGEESLFDKYLNYAIDNSDSIESEILNSISSNLVDIKSEITQNIASHSIDVKAEIAENMTLHDHIDDFQMAAVEATDSSSSYTDGETTSNSDAYSGLLGSAALQQLADSSYFTANLIQSSIMTDNDTSSSSTDTMSLSDLNNSSLLANSLGSSYSTIASSDYTAALLEAYKNNDISSSLLDFMV